MLRPDNRPSESRDAALYLTFQKGQVAGCRPVCSALAGVLEAGETVEETLVLEVREEFGPKVHHLNLFC